jgi:hypothetical protein
MREKERKPQLEYSHLYLLDGKRINNLLDIPQDACVILISDKAEFKGIEMEDVLEAKKSRKKT